MFGGVFLWTRNRKMHLISIVATTLRVWGVQSDLFGHNKGIKNES